MLRYPALRDGRWQLLDCKPAWDGNGSNESFIAFAWEGINGEYLITAVNYASHQAQCRVRLPFLNLSVRNWRLRDRLSDVVYDRSGSELQDPGLYLDLAPWHNHAFEFTALDSC